MGIHRAVSLAALLPLGARVAAAAADPDPDDVAVLREAGLTLDDKALLGFLQARTLAENDRTRILALVKKLGDDEFDVRDKASEDLESLAAPAVPPLPPALPHPASHASHPP